MALPVDVNFSILPTYRRGIGMGFRLKIPTKGYDPALKLIELKLVRYDDRSITYETDSTGDYIEAFPAVGEDHPYVLITVPSSALTSVAVEGKTSLYGINFRDDGATDPDFRLQGDLIWTDDVGDTPE